jgi:eukaryotic-like serine/threonine-protein kinase
MDDPTTQTLLVGRYQLQKSLGIGGMAVVYQARDLSLERSVAIKILRADYSRDENFRQRFHQEAKAAANLSHPNIVTIHDFGLDQDCLFIVMEYISGTDLKSIINKKGISSIDDAVDLIVQACQGLGYAHRANLVHCDIKPHNLLVTSDGRVKVGDFGIARALDTIRQTERNEFIWGSPQYISPAQASGGPPSPASDVYSVGVILYELLTGQLPFNSEDSQELLRMHREVQPELPRRLNRRIPIQLQEIVLKILSKEPSGRYRTADQLGRILSSFSTHRGPYAGGSFAIQSLASSTQPVGTFPNPQAETPTENMPVTGASLGDLKTSQSAAQPVEAEKEIEEDEAEKAFMPFGVDLLTVSLALAAFIAVGGLVPFWMLVYFSITRPFP